MATRNTISVRALEPAQTFRLTLSSLSCHPALLLYHFRGGQRVSIIGEPDASVAHLRRMVHHRPRVRRRAATASRRRVSRFRRCRARLLLSAGRSCLPAVGLRVKYKAPRKRSRTIYWLDFGQARPLPPIASASLRRWRRTGQKLTILEQVWSSCGRLQRLLLVSLDPVLVMGQTTCPPTVGQCRPSLRPCMLLMAFRRRRRVPAARLAFSFAAETEPPSVLPCSRTVPPRPPPPPPPPPSEGVHRRLQISGNTYFKNEWRVVESTSRKSQGLWASTKDRACVITVRSRSPQCGVFQATVLCSNGCELG
jgi:hypothetical protein